MRDDIDVIVHEVGPRDGLQSIQTIVPTEGKLEWIRKEAEAGVPQIQVGSFVPPKLLPQMADSAEVVRAARAIPGLTVSALVPNFKGAQNAFAAGAHQIGMVMSVSEAHNLANVRKTVEQSLDEFSRIVELKRSDPAYAGVTVSGGLATAFGCTIAGKVPVADVMRCAEALLARGADRIGVADTVGFANPRQVRDLFDELYRTVGRDVAVGAHFHDTRGLGQANAFAALEAGVRELDACLGGLGGCPYAPGATGNIVTEDLVFMLESMGLRTGIDLDLLLEARAVMEKYLHGEATHGQYPKAGAPKGFTSPSTGKTYPLEAA
jgi:hydroxymethylglutaryl-CoA lyase